MADPRPLSPKRPSALRGALAPQIKAHWQKYRPKMSKALAAKGQLDEAVQAAADRTSDALADLVAKGLAYNQAWELVREEWAFLPSEDDVPELGFDPAPLPLKLRRSAAD
jgi:hypothetical protein